MMRQGELKAASLSSPARGWLRDIASPQSAVCVGGGGGGRFPLHNQGLLGQVWKYT